MLTSTAALRHVHAGAGVLSPPSSCSLFSSALLKCLPCKDVGTRIPFLANQAGSRQWMNYMVGEYLPLTASCLRGSWASGGGQKKNHLSLVWAIGSVGLIRMQAHQLCFYQVTSQLRDWLLPRRHGKGRGLCGGGICLILLCKEVW